MPRPNALLLVGPTGSGKTPFGDEIERRGLGERACHHFDFGATLRRVVTCPETAPCLGADDIAFLRSLLKSGALLEDHHFHIAEKILGSFISRRVSGPDDLLVLNGLPRHVGQAEDMDRLVNVEAVVELVCPPGVVLERIRTNAGGDRAERVDDDLAAVRHKLAIYAERTVPLVEHYHARGARILSIPIAADTTADAAWRALVATCT
jgi:adenylate kinase family enzyme